MKLTLLIILLVLIAWSIVDNKYHDKPIYVLVNKVLITIISLGVLFGGGIFAFFNH